MQAAQWWRASAAGVGDEGDTWGPNGGPSVGGGCMRGSAWAPCRRLPPTSHADLHLELCAETGWVALHGAVWVPPSHISIHKTLTSAEPTELMGRRA